VSGHGSLISSSISTPCASSIDICTRSDDGAAALPAAVHDDAKGAATACRWVLQQGWVV
jgi:hypothetical protein